MARYIGRGDSRLGLEPSSWKKPFPICHTRTRRQAIAAFRKWVRTQASLMQNIGALEGTTLVCHCRLSQACHAEVLQELVQEYKDRLIKDSEAPPADEHAALEAADQRRLQANQLAQKKHQAPVAPTVDFGIGPAITVHSGSKRRLFCDGGGLCSPGLWEPHHRSQAKAGIRLQEAIAAELDTWDRTSPGILHKTIAALCTGHVETNPFPDEATQRLRCALPKMLSNVWREWQPTASSRTQPIDVRALGAFTQACGDPDFQVLRDFDSGVPIGMGVELPRTPMVFPPKQKWSLAEQEDWEAHQHKLII